YTTADDAHQDPPGSRGVCPIQPACYRLLPAWSVRTVLRRSDGWFEQTGRDRIRQGGAPVRRCDDVLSCPACGATAPPMSTWCGQCYTVFNAPPVAAPAPAPVAVAPSRGFAPPPWATPPAPATGYGPVAPWAGPPPGGTAEPVPAPSNVSPPLPHRAVVLTIVAITIGAIAMGVSYLLGQDQNIAPATYLRYAIVLTLAVYAVVGVLVVTQITPSVRLRWSDGQPAMGVAI